MLYTEYSKSTVLTEYNLNYNVLWLFLVTNQVQEINKDYMYNTHRVRNINIVNNKTLDDILIVFKAFKLKHRCKYPVQMKCCPWKRYTVPNRQTDISCTSTTTSISLSFNA